MNRFLVVPLVLVLCWLYGLALGADSPAVENARRQGARGQVTLCVTDSTGKPVEKAQVRAAFIRSDSGMNAADVSEVLTDGNGCVRLEGTTIADMNYRITKDGYYKTTGRYWFHRQGEDCVREGRWLPWNPTITVVLKERRGPVAMYAKQVDVRIPARDQGLGFDLEKGDWVAPHGQGVTADLVIRYTATYEGPLTFSKRLEITFSNPGDGVQVFPFDKTSEFISLHNAPEEGYTPTLVDEQARTRTKILKSPDIGKGQYLVFRVRSVTNEQGRIVSANYGKIYGPNREEPIDYGRMGDVDRLLFTCYLNPTANDRNLEFDPSRNLLGTSDGRRVYHP